MDGLNPTLALAALFFGLAGHPNDEAAQSQSYDEAPRAAEQLAEVSVCADYAQVAQDGGAIFLDKFGQGETLTAARSGTDESAFDDLESFMADDGSLIVSDATELRDANGCGYLPPQP